MSPRVMAVWCPDWPVVAAVREAGGRQADAAAVFRANRVVACNAAARKEGIRTRMRRRDAQSRWPRLQVLADDPDRDARMFEPLAAAVEQVIPGVEVLRPGLLLCPAEAAVRALGSLESVAERVLDVVESWDVECQVGAADTVGVACLAARRQVLVPPGQDAAFCAPLPITALALERGMAGTDQPGLVELFLQLGITTLGAFAALPRDKVVARFGAGGLAAHRLVRGEEERGLARRPIADDLGVEQVCDPPLDRVDSAAFLARALAGRFHDRLAAAGSACTRVAITAATDQGRELTRVWRVARPLTPDATADRLRWQLDGWLTAGRRHTTPDRSGRTPQERAAAADGFDPGPDPSTGNGPGGIVRLRLEPVDMVSSGLVQYGLWGEEGEQDHRAGWAFTRVQGLLGPGAVLCPVRSGGRGPAERITFVPWGEEKIPERDPAAPWPGRLPAPSPARLSTARVELLDGDARPVRLTPRGLLTADPAFVTEAGSGTSAVVAWAGPWLLDERWWERRSPEKDQDRPDANWINAALDAQLLTTPPARPARLQVVTDTGTALLLIATGEGWHLDGVYD